MGFWLSAPAWLGSGTSSCPYCQDAGCSELAAAAHGTPGSSNLFLAPQPPVRMQLNLFLQEIQGLSGQHSIPACPGAFATPGAAVGPEGGEEARDEY